jgi:enoyl-CoA hydratase/carnithine racemase
MKREDMPMAKPIIVERKGPFATITLNRPRRGNVFTHTMMQQLSAHVDEIAADPNLRAIILRGNGKDFCHGRDPKGPGGPPPDNAFDLHGKVFSKILDVYKAFRDCPAPIVTVVQGKALGFGCALVGGSDIAIASDGARFALPEMGHGIAPTLAMSALAKVAPKAVANMVYSMEEIDAPAALAVGLVSQVVNADGLDDTLDSLLGRLASYDVAAIRTIKRFLATGPQLDPGTMSDLAGYTLATVATRPK